MIKNKYKTPKEKTAIQAAVSMLSKSQHSAKMLCDKLEQKGYEEQSVQEAISYLKERNFIDDKKYSQNRAELLVKKGKSPALITLELKECGIDDAIIAQTIESIKSQITPQEQIQSIINKKFKNADLSGESNFIKAAQYLTRRGFSQEDIEKALQNK
jgi:regulatory protein